MNNQPRVIDNESIGVFKALGIVFSSLTNVVVQSCSVAQRLLNAVDNTAAMAEVATKAMLDEQTLANEQLMRRLQEEGEAQ